MNAFKGFAISLLIFAVSLSTASAAGFAETINLDSIGIAAGVALDDDGNFAGTLAIAPNPAYMESEVYAGVDATGGAVSQETEAAGAEVFTGSMAGDLNEVDGSLFSTISQVYTTTQVANGGLITNQGADTVDDLEAYQSGTIAEGSEVSTSTYAENEEGYSQADSFILDGSILCETWAHSCDDDTIAWSWNDIKGLDGFMNGGSEAYDIAGAYSEAGFTGYGTMTGSAWTWQDGISANAWML